MNVYSLVYPAAYKMTEELQLNNPTEKCFTNKIFPQVITIKTTSAKPQRPASDHSRRFLHGKKKQKTIPSI